MTDNTLFLSVRNPEKLVLGSLPNSIFSTQGGNIGSDKSSCHWCLKNYSMSIQNVHCEIRYINRKFCLIEREGPVYINNSDKPLGENIIVAISNGDFIKIGEYIIFAEIFGKNVTSTADLDFEGLLGLNNNNQLLDDIALGRNQFVFEKNADNNSLLLPENEVNLLDPMLKFNKLNNDETVSGLIPLDNLGLNEKNQIGFDQSNSITRAINLSGNKVNNEKKRKSHDKEKE